MSQVKLSSDFTITIPEDERKKLKAKPGMTFIIFPFGEGMYLSPQEKFNEDQIEYFSYLKKSPSYGEFEKDSDEDLYTREDIKPLS